MQYCEVMETLVGQYRGYNIYFSQQVYTGTVRPCGGTEYYFAVNVSNPKRPVGDTADNAPSIGMVKFKVDNCIDGIKFHGERHFTTPFIHHRYRELIKLEGVA